MTLKLALHITDPLTLFYLFMTSELCITYYWPMYSLLLTTDFWTIPLRFLYSWLLKPFLLFIPLLCYLHLSMVAYPYSTRKYSIYPPSHCVLFLLIFPWHIYVFRVVQFQCNVFYMHYHLSLWRLCLAVNRTKYTIYLCVVNIASKCRDMKAVSHSLGRRFSLV